MIFTVSDGQSEMLKAAVENGHSKKVFIRPSAGSRTLNAVALIIRHNPCKIEEFLESGFLQIATGGTFVDM